MARRYGQQDVDKPKPRNDAYTGLLGVSLAAMLIGCLLLFLDYNSYDANKPPNVMKNLPQLPKIAANLPPPGAGEVAPPKNPAKKVEEKKVEAKKEPAKKEEPKKKEEEKKDDGKKKEEAKKDDGKKKDEEKKKDEK